MLFLCPSLVNAVVAWRCHEKQRRHSPWDPTSVHRAVRTEAQGPHPGAGEYDGKRPRSIVCARRPVGCIDVILIRITISASEKIKKSKAVAYPLCKSEEKRIIDK